MDILDNFLSAAQRRVMQKDGGIYWGGLLTASYRGGPIDESFGASKQDWKSRLQTDIVSQLRPDATLEAHRLFALEKHSIAAGTEQVEAKRLDGSSPIMVSALMFHRWYREAHGYNYPALVRLDDDPPQLCVFAVHQPHMTASLTAYSAAMHYVAPKDPRYAARVSMKQYE